MTCRGPSVIAFLVGAFVTTAALAEESLPHVRVLARTPPKTFEDIVAEASVPKLLHSVADHVAKKAQSAMPCMEWSADVPKPGLPRPDARLILIFRREANNNFFKVRLFLRVAVGTGSEQTLDEWSLVVIDSLKEFPRVSGFDRVLRLMAEKITAQLDGDELQSFLNAKFIRYVPITSTIQLDNDDDNNNGRIIVPVNADHLRLADSSPVLVIIKGEPFCSKRPENCEVTLLSLGPTPSRLLNCKVDGSNCCNPLPWVIVRKLQDIKAKNVYLGEKHRHCARIDKECRSDGVARGIGLPLSGGPS